MRKREILVFTFLILSWHIKCQITGELNIPNQTSTMPSWAKLMYEEPINFIRLSEAYNSFTSQILMSKITTHDIIRD